MNARDSRRAFPDRDASPAAAARDQIRAPSGRASASATSAGAPPPSRAPANPSSISTDAIRSSAILSFSKIIATTPAAPKSSRSTRRNTTPTSRAAGRCPPRPKSSPSACAPASASSSCAGVTAPRSTSRAMAISSRRKSRDDSPSHAIEPRRRSRRPGKKERGRRAPRICPSSMSDPPARPQPENGHHVSHRRFSSSGKSRHSRGASVSSLHTQSPVG